VEESFAKMMNVSDIEALAKLIGSGRAAEEVQIFSQILAR
jgi:hypothetical protein